MASHAWVGVLNLDVLQGGALRRAKRTNTSFVLEQRASMRTRLVADGELLASVAKWEGFTSSTSVVV